MHREVDLLLQYLQSHLRQFPHPCPSNARHSGGTWWPFSNRPPKFEWDSRQPRVRSWRPPLCKSTRVGPCYAFLPRAWSGTLHNVMPEAQWYEWHSCKSSRNGSISNMFPWCDARLTGHPLSWSQLRPGWWSCTAGSSECYRKRTKMSGITTSSLYRFFDLRCFFFLPNVMRDGWSGKVLDLFTNDRDTTLIRSVQFQYTGSDHLRPICQKKMMEGGQNNRCFSDKSREPATTEVDRSSSP